MKNYAMIIDYKYCTGCHTCEVACRKEKGMGLDQWGIKLTEHGPVKFDDQWMWNYVPVPSNLCDLCIDRIQEGKKPACAHHCLAQCMEIVPVEEVSAKIAGMGAGVTVFVPAE